MRKSGETILHQICLLGMSKHIIYDFHYNIIKTTFHNVELLGQDTSSLFAQLNDQGNTIHKMCDMYKSFDYLEWKTRAISMGNL